jgi:hypothetical protein
MLFSPSDSGACASSARRTVRASSASSRFRAATSARVRSNRPGVGVWKRSSAASASSTPESASMPAPFEHMSEF